MQRHLALDRGLNFLRVESDLEPAHRYYGRPVIFLSSTPSPLHRISLCRSTAIERQCLEKAPNGVCVAVRMAHTAVRYQKNVPSIAIQDPPG